MKYVLPFDLKDEEQKKSLWKGTLELRVPLNHERLAIMAKHNTHKLKGTGGKQDSKAVDAIFESQIPILSAVYGDMRNLIEKVDIVGPEGVHVTTLEEFETHPDLGMAWMIIAAQYCEGFGPGKTKSRS